MEKALYQCMTKATDREKDQVRSSKNWVNSKRVKLKKYNDKIVCDSWHFDMDQIRNLSLYNTKQMFIPVKVLAFDYEDKTYQFGLNPWASPIEHINLEYKEENVKIKYSTFSIISRVIILAVAFTLLFGKF